MKTTTKNTLEHPADHTSNGINAQARGILAIWKANREFRMQDIQFEDFEKLASEYGALLEKIETGARAMHELRVTRNKLEPKVEKWSSRARSGMRGYFGPKSSEYRRVRLAQSKTPAPKARKPAPVTPGE